MLDFLRKSKKGVLGILMAGFAGALLLPFGVDMMQSPQTSRGTVIRVGEKEYTSREYFSRLERWRRMFLNQFGQRYAEVQPMLNLEQRTVDDIVQESLIEQVSGRLQLTASTGQIENKIKSHPFFGGNVTQQSYEAFLNAQGMNGAMLEAVTKRQVAVEQLGALLRDLSLPTEVELKSVYRDQNRKASFKYLSFSPAQFLEKVDVSKEEELKAYFTDNAEKYRKPRGVRFSYSAFRPTEFLQAVELSEDDIAAAYEKERHTFVEPKEVRLRQIMLKKEKSSEETPNLEKMLLGKAETPKADDPANAEKKALADKTYERAQAGEDFAALASSTSQDPATSPKGGDMGWMKYTDLDPAFRAAIAKLDEKEVSNVVETKEAYHIFRVEEKKEARTKELAEVRAEIESELRKADAPIYAQAKANDIFDAWQKAGDKPLLEFAKEQGINASESGGFVSAKNKPGEIPAGLAEKTVTLPAGSKELVTVGDDVFLVEITEVQEAVIPEFSEVREAVVNDYKQERSVTLAKKAADDSLNRLREAVKVKPLDAAFEDLAKEHNLPVEATSPESRASATSPLFFSTDLRRAAFSLNADQPVAAQVFDSNGNFVVIAFASGVLPEEAEFAEKKEELRKRSADEAGQRLMAALLETLKARTDIWVDPNLVQGGVS